MTKELLSCLVDQLPSRERDAACDDLERLRAESDLVLHTPFEAPEDDQERTAEGRIVLEEAGEGFRIGRVLTPEDVTRRLGRT